MVKVRRRGHSGRGWKLGMTLLIKDPSPPLPSPLSLPPLPARPPPLLILIPILFSLFPSYFSSHPSPPPPFPSTTHSFPHSSPCLLPFLPFFILTSLHLPLLLPLLNLPSPLPHSTKGISLFRCGKSTKFVIYESCPGPTVAMTPNCSYKGIEEG